MNFPDTMIYIYKPIHTEYLWATTLTSKKTQQSPQTNNKEVIYSQALGYNCICSEENTHVRLSCQSDNCHCLTRALQQRNSLYLWKSHLETMQQPTTIQEKKTPLTAELRCYLPSHTWTSKKGHQVATAYTREGPDFEKNIPSTH